VSELTREQQVRLWHRPAPHWPADCWCEECRPDSWRNHEGRVLENRVADLERALAAEKAAREEAGRENERHTRDWWKMLVAIAEAVDTEGDPEALAAEDFDPWEALRKVKADAEALRRASESAERREKELREALEFYADPETYFAVGFFPDPPCGEFMDDFDGQRPGKRARAALASVPAEQGEDSPASPPPSVGE
jgi:hypothetical protein